MATEVLMPKLGLTMTEGTIEEWKIKEGEPVKKGDVLFSVATDKLTNDVEADADGVLLKILLPEGETAECKSVIAWIGQPGEAIPGAGAAPAAAAPAAAPAELPASASLVIMPKQGLMMTEGTIIKWLVKEGEQVRQGQTLGTASRTIVAEVRIGDVPVEPFAVWRMQCDAIKTIQ